MMPEQFQKFSLRTRTLTELWLLHLLAPTPSSCSSTPFDLVCNHLPTNHRTTLRHSCACLCCPPTRLIALISALASTTSQLSFDTSSPLCIFSIDLRLPFAIETERKNQQKRNPHRCLYNDDYQIHRVKHGLVVVPTWKRSSGDNLFLFLSEHYQLDEVVSPSFGSFSVSSNATEGS